MGSFDMNIIIRYFKMKVKKDNIYLLFPFCIALRVGLHKLYWAHSNMELVHKYQIYLLW